MKYRWTMGLALLLIMGAIAAWAQESTVVDFSSWLQRQGALASCSTADAQARQTVHARIATVRGDRGKLVAQARRGRWQSERYSRSAQPWFVQLNENHDDGTITGRLTVVGSGLFSSGKISGTSDGTTVSGIVTDDKGTQLATFTGSLLPGGAMSGSYTTSDGDVGSWGVDSD